MTKRTKLFTEICVGDVRRAFAQHGYDVRGYGDDQILTATLQSAAPARVMSSDQLFSSAFAALKVM